MHPLNRASTALVLETIDVVATHAAAHATLDTLAATLDAGATVTAPSSVAGERAWYRDVPHDPSPLATVRGPFLR